MTKVLILTTEKAGHYKSYAELCVKLLSGNICDVTVKEAARYSEVLSVEKLVLIDGDSAHLALSPLIFLRAMFNKPTTLLSVRTEDFIGKRIKSKIKRCLLRLLVCCKRVNFLSIHYPDMCEYEGDFITKCFYDPQLWDLPLLNSGANIPSELDSDLRQGVTLLVLGALNEKRCKTDLLDKVASFPSIHFVFAGRLQSEDEAVLIGLSNVTVINRYVSDEEIIGLYNSCSYVYAFYSNDVCRPSGVFGRAVQLGKKVVIRKGGYIDAYFGDYVGVVSVGSLEELDLLLVDRKECSKGGSIRDYDHSEILKSYLLL